MIHQISALTRYRRSDITLLMQTSRQVPFLPPSPAPRLPFPSFVFLPLVLLFPSILTASTLILLSPDPSLKNEVINENSRILSIYSLPRDLERYGMNSMLFSFCSVHVLEQSELIFRTKLFSMSVF